MKYILNGDDIVSSRKYLSDLIIGKTPTSLDGRVISVSDLGITLVSDGLFETAKTVVIENLISKNVNKKEYIEFLNNYNGSTDIILWEDKKILKSSYEKLKDFIVKDFLLPQNYFQFLDNFFPGNPKKVFQLYHSLLPNLSPELVFYSLIKRLRLLLVLNSNEMIEDLSKMAPWQVGRLKNQLKLWSGTRLVEIYKELCDLEINMKSGKLPLSISKSLDTLILIHLR